MKALIFFIGLFLFQYAYSVDTLKCAPGLMNVWTESNGASCAKKFPAEENFLCLAKEAPAVADIFQDFPKSLFTTEELPWWASQGNLYYPNVSYPGAWEYPGIQSKYYPGEGEVFAAKPNVYIDSIYKEKKFNFKFTSSTKPHFLATTPSLDKTTGWTGKIVENDKFEIEDIYYDYLFYDVRLPKEKMQFDHGVCATRLGAIEFMLKDLKEMKFSLIALQDFEEHWRVKIPAYPFYCIYPQYNHELDPALPVEISVEHHTFLRSLYVLVPHKTGPDINEPQDISLPTKDHAQFRPGAKIQRENMFREWGVAFLGY
jgi:hypothetical protein